MMLQKLGTSHDVKALPLVHFWSVLLLKEQNNDDVCYNNVKNAGLISAKPIDF